MSGPFAFVTLLSSDSYLPGALVLAASLKDLHPTPATPPEVDFQTVCLVTPETVNVSSIKSLRKVFDVVIGVEILEANSPSGLKLLGRPDLSTVLTKLHVFRLTTYSKIIFLDADVLPLQPISHLFLTPHEFSACPDVGWPDIFNTGLMVLQPGDEKFQELMSLVKSKGSWDGADQGLLNEWRGNSWTRLSFVYNTTPTAAYTYAPAYERFATTIRAIHFIGQNKPWASIPWRAPIPHPSAESMSSYGYGQLVDRWFAVYDRHYRPPVIASEEEYRMQHYPSTWESATFEAASTGLGLEELRKMAIDGVLKTAPTASGEGTYTSLPLEGRVDLMRPRKPPPESIADLPGGVPIGDQPGTSHHEAHGEHRPPGREGLPDYLYRPPAPEEQAQQARSQEEYMAFSSRQSEEPQVHHVQPVPWHQQQQEQQQQQQQTEAQDDRQGAQSPDYRPPSPPKMNWDPAREPPPSVLPPIVGMAFAEQQYQNVWDMFPSGHHQRTPYQDPWAATRHHEQGSQGYQQQHQQQHYHQSHQIFPDSHRGGQQAHHSEHHRSHQHGHSPKHHQHQRHEQHQHHSYSHYQQPSQPHDQHRQYIGQHDGHRAHDSYAASYGPYHVPPTEQRHESVKDDHSYFTYQHDSGDRRQSRPEGTHQYHQRPQDFFHPPAPSSIPRHLLREGNYTAVTSEQPKPDSAKVVPLFPWEQQSRPTPKRVFPDWDPRPPALRSPPKANNLLLEDIFAVAQPAVTEEITGRRSPSPPPHVRRKFNPPPSPPQRQGGTYANAWDEDRGIQRYAYVLQGRSSPYSPLPWPTHPGQIALAKEKESKEENDEGEYTNWAERAEASSRDGDDEDDEEGSPLLSPKSAARRRAAKGKGNSYRNQGVQTDPIMTVSRGVQVNTYVPQLQETTRRYSSTGAGPGLAMDLLERSSSPAIKDDSNAVKQERQGLYLADATSYFPSNELGQMSQSIKESAGIGTPTTPVLRKRESSEESEATAPDSSIISSPTKEVEEETITSKVNIRGADATDSPTLVGARMPSGDGAPVRRTGRVFSPTTGVDIFKKGSEEVLARFLKQQPMGWDAARQDMGPPTPSAIH